jgi:hypothetical protein
MSDICGLVILLVPVLLAIYGINRISKPDVLTKDEYERRLKASSGIAGGAMKSMMYPFQELLNPEAVEAIHVIKDMTEGHYDVRQEQGGDNVPDLTPPPPENAGTDHPAQVEHRSMFDRFIRRVHSIFRKA